MSTSDDASGQLAEDLLRTLAAATDGKASRLDTALERLGRGRSADLFRFRISADSPSELCGRDLVLRVLPRNASSVRECVIQRYVADQGFPAPKVRLIGEFDDGSGHRFAMVMDHIDAVTLFDAVGPMRALRSVPPRLASLMVTLHRLDPAPIVAELDRLGLDQSAPVEDAALEQIDSCLGAVAHPQHPALCDWLQQRRPAAGRRRVVCHGDLHALNVLGEADDAMVIDWELATVADPAYDVARTKLLIQAVPLDMPRPVRSIVQRLGRRAARQFETHYTVTAPVDRASLTWHEALHAARMLALVLGRGPSTHRPTDGVLDAWTPTLPFLTTQLGRLTGIAVEWS